MEVQVFFGCCFFVTYDIWSNQRTLNKTIVGQTVYFFFFGGGGGYAKRDDALMRESPESCSDGISEPKRLKYSCNVFS